MSATQETIDQIMKSQISTFADEFKRKYSNRGTGLKNLANKANNPFILALGEEIVIYSALMRSLDSSLGNRLESIARAIAESSYHVKNEVKGDLPLIADDQISNLMNAYRDKKRRPQVTDLEEITISRDTSSLTRYRTHKSDYYLVKKSDDRQHFLIELKIGGDLDSKKAPAEKRALLLQYAILKSSTNIRSDSVIQIYFATAYNKAGEDEIWQQGSVLQYFSREELLIGRDFWNFICDSNEGNKMVIEAYKKYAHLLKAALENIIEVARQEKKSQNTSLWEGDLM